MAHHVIEFDQECKSCKGTGLYVGIAERDGAAVVCNVCKGKGCHHVKIEYDDFLERNTHENVEQVYECNPGVVIGKGERGDKFKLSDFGGMPYSNWLSGVSFSPGMENRKFTCPVWWYQNADYSKKPNWIECVGAGSTFSKCPHFAEKDKCWERWDKEQNHETEKTENHKCS